MNNQNHQISPNVSEKRLSENGLATMRNHGLELASHSSSSFAIEEDSKSLKDYLSILQRQALVITGVIVVGMTGVTYSAMNKELIYQGNFQLLVEPIDNDNVGKLTLTESHLSNPIGLDYESQIQVLRSPERLQKVIQDLRQFYPDITYVSLMQNLSIRRLGQTKVLEVTYKSNDPKKIKTVLDILSQYYLKYSLDQRQTKLRQGLQFVDKQLPDIQNRVVQLQKELQIFRQRYNFIDPENQSSSVSSQIQSLTQQRLALNQQIVAARANYLSLQQPQEQLLILNSSPTYQQLINQQRQLEVQISGELARFEPDNPIIVTLQEKKSNLAPLIQQEARRVLTIKLAEAEAILKKVEVDNQLLGRTEQQLQQKLNQLPVLSRQYTDIQRNLQLANESLTRFLANREKLQIEVAQTELPWSLIQAPQEPQFPIAPNIPQHILLGLMMSSLLGVGAAFLMEEMDNTYHNVDKIKEKIKLPILGVLPFDKSISFLLDRSVKPHQQSLEPANNQVSSQRQLANNLESNSYTSQNYYYQQGAFWEAFQVLYANLQLLNSDQPISSLVVSSSLPGDGKSTIAFHLAKIATSMGKKVLLVDADLRLPCLHELSGLKNLWGLSNLISTNIPPEQIMQQIPEMKNLSIITAGPIPPDPARLLSSDKMKQLMAYFQENFDLVIYDAPPMLGLVDARLLAPHTDGIMLVVRMNKTDKSALMQLQDSLRMSPLNVLGIVVNGDKSHAKTYQSYYSSYQQYPNTEVISR